MKSVLQIILIFAHAGVVFAASEDNPKYFPPFRIVGNLYYVGDNYQSDYLIVTSQGDILINAGFEADVPMIKANVEKLGFKFSDIKILLISQAHNDHVGGAAIVKNETGAKYMVMDADVPVVESGGKADFQYGNSDTPINFYQRTTVDRVLHDGDEVRLGNTVLRAHLTGGHTKGCTTWTMNIAEKGKAYRVVIMGGLSVNPGYQLIYNAEYPQIAQDYELAFKTSKSLPCDIFLGAHGVYFDLEKKYALIGKDNKNPFIDPQGYQKYIATKELDFYKEFLKQKNG